MRYQLTTTMENQLKKALLGFGAVAAILLTGGVALAASTPDSAVALSFDNLPSVRVLDTRLDGSTLGAQRGSMSRSRSAERCHIGRRQPDGRRSFAAIVPRDVPDRQRTSRHLQHQLERRRRDCKPDRRASPLESFDHSVQQPGHGQRHHRSPRLLLTQPRQFGRSGFGRSSGSSRSSGSCRRHHSRRQALGHHRSQHHRFAGRRTAYRPVEGAAAPVGDGSLGFAVANASEKVAFGNEVDYKGEMVTGINKVGFSVFTTGEDQKINIDNLPNITFEVDPTGFANTTGPNYSSLVFNPAGAGLTTNTFSAIDATSATAGVWYFTGATGTTSVATKPRSAPSSN